MLRSPRKGAPTHPHDALFNWTFSQREHAMGLLKAAVPPALAAAVDFRTLRLEKGSFVDKALRSRHSDLVFSARLGGTVTYIYMLVEHERDVEAVMVFRMALYIMSLWAQLVREKPRLKKLPPIIPILMHHSDTGEGGKRALPKRRAPTEKRAPRG
jgi:predicted transposase/invertase (TIGR01784 family)